MRVLVGTDGSPASSVALDLVAAADWPPGTTIRVIEAIDPAVGPFGGAWPNVAIVETETLESTLRQVARDTVRAACDRLVRPDLHVTGDVRYGRPSTVVVDAARELNVDLIVVGSRGHGTISSMLLGSVSAEVVDHASVPVLVARGRSLNRVVLGWDGSDSARAAAGLLRSWKVFAASTISVVSVAEIDAPWWTGFPEVDTAEATPMYLDAADTERRARDDLASQMAADLRSVGLDATAARRDGDPAAQLIEAARISSADLIVLGTHGRTGLTRLVLGSVARNVLLHAPCSVLIARARGAGT